MSHRFAAPQASAVDGSPPIQSSRESGFDLVREALKGIRYGEVRVIVQDGLIVQIERLEKHRLR